MLNQYWGLAEMFRESWDERCLASAACHPRICSPSGRVYPECIRATADPYCCAPLARTNRLVCISLATKSVTFESRALLCGIQLNYCHKPFVLLLVWVQLPENEGLQRVL